MIARVCSATDWLNTVVGIYRTVRAVTPLDDQDSVGYSTILATKIKYPAFDNLELTEQRDLFAAGFIAVDRYNAAGVPDHRTPYLLKEARGLRLAEHDAIINTIVEIDDNLRATRGGSPAAWRAPMDA
jgi:hypothetical protein